MDVCVNSGKRWTEEKKLGWWSASVFTDILNGTFSSLDPVDVQTSSHRLWSRDYKRAGKLSKVTSHRVPFSSTP